MSLRETLNENPAITTAVTVGIIVAVLMFMLYQFGLFSAGGGRGTAARIYLSDDGASYYVGTTDDLYTVGSDGQPKAQAHVYQYPSQEPKIWFLERFHPRVVELHHQMKSGTAPESAMVYESMQFNSSQVRRPNETEWHDKRSPEGMAISKSPPPSQNGEQATRLLP